MKAQAKTKNQRDFEIFWKAYDYKKGKPYALAAWNRLSKEDRKAAIERIPAYLEDCELCHREQKYPQGYLNGRLWEDETKKEREERKAAEKAAIEATEKSEHIEVAPDGPQRDWMGFRINGGVTGEERQRFEELRSALQRKWTQHTNNYGDFTALLNSLQLDGVNDERHVIRIGRRDGGSWNREYIAAYYWELSDFDRLVTLQFPGCTWTC